jgi:DNA (cytosine-5)-methyltransferase 1
MSAPTFIDLFCGCGGFTLGMQRAGFDCLAAVDFNSQAVATLRANLQAKRPTGLKPGAFALEADLTALAPETLAAVIGTRSTDVIVGGPPRQGFSTARQRDGSNQGTERPSKNPRRHRCSDGQAATLKAATFSTRSSANTRSTSDSTLAVQM